MYSAPHLAIKYLRHYCTAFNGKGHGMHSPFIFQFIIKILNDQKKYDSYETVENLRRQLLKDSRMFVVEDFGAGSAFLRKHQRSIKSIARNAAKSKKYGQLLYRIVKYYQPKTILELGTSLGITTSYLSLAKPDAKLITMEGAREIASVARQNFDKLSIKNIELIEGNFDLMLPGLLERTPVIDFAFIDGNHRQEPTERYFNQLLAKMHNESILVFDDIHWSREMEQVWKTIKDHPSVRCTVDLFFIGIVFFRDEFKGKQHFSIRF
ncbi:MAG: class I SAM-dependent methyltransferase [Chitinophagaceae bacterium]|nr:class I SAM-dependent methyltransferase [Chitinophagaceae bacterium]